MNIIYNILHTYASFFNAQVWIDAFNNVEGWIQAVMLAGLEGLLSADNALVLAIMVAVLPIAMRKKALFYGLWGAIFFRFFFIGLGRYLVSITWIKYLGAAYLAWLVIEHFFKKEDEEAEEVEVTKGYWAKLVGFIGIFWVVVFRVELMDVSFSADSILAALAFSDKVAILLVGGTMGIVMMRAVSSVFLKLIERVPLMEHTAYILIGIIAVKMAISDWYELNQWIFFGILIGTFVGTFIVQKALPTKLDKDLKGETA